MAACLPRCVEWLLLPLRLVGVCMVLHDLPYSMSVCMHASTAGTYVCQRVLYMKYAKQFEYNNHMWHWSTGTYVLTWCGYPHDTMPPLDPRHSH